MSDHTEFIGSFKLDKPLLPEHAAYLKAFADTRRMKRNAAMTAEREDLLRQAVGLPVGIEGGYFVGEGGFMGQDHGPDLADYNQPPSGQPSLWCQWIPNEDGTAIEWDCGEKYYHYAKWLVYLIDHFLEPWGYVINGEVEWQSEDHDDFGKLVVKDNMVSSLVGKRVFG